MDEVRSLIPGFEFLLQAIHDNKLYEAESLDQIGVCYIAAQHTNHTWHATEHRLPEPEFVNLFKVHPSDPVAWKALKLLPKAKESFLIHAQLLPMPVANDAGAGFFPLALLCIGVESELILGFQLLEADAWKATATSALLQILKTAKALPTSLHISDVRILPLAKEAASMLGVKVFENDQAAALLDDVFDSLGAGLGF